jgi:CubicO group peptidase (beta-lactamase class C family)
MQTGRRIGISYRKLTPPMRIRAAILTWCRLQLLNPILFTSIIILMKQLVYLSCMALLLCSCKKKDLGVTPDFSFNIDKFEQNIKTTYSGQTAGFSFSISVGDQVKKYGAWGNARLGDDGIDAYTPETRQHIFSVSKFVTAVAICKALNSLNKTLDEKVKKYLPTSWTIHSDYDDLTFRELLSHKSGFTVESDFYNTLRDMIAQPQGNQAYDYNNSNFTLCRILLPYLRYDRNWLEQQPGGLEATTAILFRNQVRELVLQPSGLTHWDLADFKDWTHVNADSYRAPRYYVMDKTDEPSLELGDYILRSGAGAHVLSSYEVAQILKAYENKKILPESWISEMKTSLCGFDNAETGEHGNYYWKNGGFQDGEGRGGEALIMIFPYNVQVCILANSNRTSNDQFVGKPSLMAKAYDDAW